MKIKRNHYIIINMHDINDENKREEVKQIFEKYNIEEAYQKIILKLAIFDMIYNCDAIELLTDEKFYFEPKTYDRLLNNELTELNIASTNLNITTKAKFYHKEKIQKLVQGIIDSKLSKNYESAIKEIFSKSKKLTRNK